MMNDTFRTRDLPAAAILMMEKQKLLETEREGTICWFVFEDREKCEAIVNKFWFSKFSVDAKEFYQALNVVKKRIFSEK